MSETRKPYSAEVILRLVVADQVLALSQVGPSFVLLREFAEAESGNGRVEVIIDQRVASSRQVFLPHGISRDSKRVALI